MRSRDFLSRTIAISLAAATWGQVAQAQDTAAAAQTPNDAASTGSGSEALGEIIVTAQKRAESLQATPLAITALSAEDIRRQRIAAVTDLTAIAPSVSITTTSAGLGNIQLFIRGIGESEAILTSDSPIGLYVDGVIIGRSTGAAFDVVDLERVEVLRGPQGTLYGRNTIGGAINLISRKPSQDFGIDANVDVGNYDYLQGKFGLDTGELGSSGLSARFSYLHKQRDGYVNNRLAPGDKDPGAVELDAFRAALRFVSGDLTLDYAFDYSDKRGYAPAFQLALARPDILAYLNQSPALGGTAPELSLSRLDDINNTPGRIRDRSTGHTFVAELDLGSVTIRSLTGYRTWKAVNDFDDLDGNAGLLGVTTTGVQPINLFTASNRRRQHQFSEEINILGNIGDRLNYILGGYYFHEHAKERNPQNFLFVIGGVGIPLSSVTSYEHFSTSKAAFGQVEYELTDTLKLIGGLRYTKDEKHLDQVSPFVRDVQETFSKLNYSATINWQASPNAMIYARTASGYKAGGFMARSPSNDPYKPENLTSYEIGAKTDMFDRRLRLNFAAFYAKHDDVQVNQLLSGSGGAASIVVNAGKAHYWGIESEIAAVPVDGLRLGSNIGYTNRNYDEFVIRDPATNLLVDVADTATFVISAAWTVSAYADWKIASFGVGDLSARVDYDYRSSIHFQPTVYGTPVKDQIADGPRSLVNARLALSDVKIGSATGEIALWGRNIFNEKYRISGIDFGSLGFAGNVYGEPTTYGVSFRVTM